MPSSTRPSFPRSFTSGVSMPLRGSIAAAIACAVNEPRLGPAASQHDRVAVLPVVAAGAIVDAGRAADLAHDRGHARGGLAPGGPRGLAPGRPRAGVAPADIVAVGLDTPGPASAEGVLSARGSTNFAHAAWAGFDLRGQLAKRLQRPVVYLNDGNAAAIPKHIR